MCIPGRVAAQFKALQYVPLKGFVCLCVCFPQPVSSQSDSPASIKLPHTLLNTFSSQVFEQVQHANAVRKQHRVSD